MAWVFCAVCSLERVEAVDLLEQRVGVAADVHSRMVCNLLGLKRVAAPCHTKRTMWPAMGLVGHYKTTLFCLQNMLSRQPPQNNRPEHSPFSSYIDPVRC